MALERLSAETFNFYAPRFEVEINNRSVTANFSKAILEVTVEEKVDEGASFRLTVHDEFDRRTQTFKWLDHELFNAGNSITIKIGYENNLSTVVMGKITSIEPSFFAGESPTFTIGGQDLSYDYMKRPSPERTFLEQSYSDIARTIASEAGLQIIADDVTAYRPFVRKGNDQTYFDFLETLADEVDFQFRMDGQTVYFVQPTDDEREILTLELGKDIISFQPAIRTTGLLTEVEVRGHNPRNPSQPIVGRARAGEERSRESGGATGGQVAEALDVARRRVITGVSVNSVEHANAMARAELNRASDTLVEGSGECVGIPQIRTGVTIRLEKMGERFSGKYYVKGVTHTLNDSGYRTRFSVRRNSVERRTL